MENSSSLISTCASQFAANMMEESDIPHTLPFELSRELHSLYDKVQKALPHTPLTIISQRMKQLGWICSSLSQPSTTVSWRVDQSAQQIELYFIVNHGVKYLAVAVRPPAAGERGLRGGAHAADLRYRLRGRAGGRLHRGHARDRVRVALAGGGAGQREADGGGRGRAGRQLLQGEREEGEGRLQGGSGGEPVRDRAAVPDGPQGGHLLHLHGHPRGRHQGLLHRRHRLPHRLLPQVPRPHAQGLRVAAAQRNQPRGGRHQGRQRAGRGPLQPGRTHARQGHQCRGAARRGGGRARRRRGRGRRGRGRA